MDSDEIRALVNGYTCTVGGIPYQFTVQWMAAEKNSDPAAASHLLRLEVEPLRQAGGSPEKFLLFTWVTRPAELPSMLEDALRIHLAKTRAGLQLLTS